MQDSGTGEGSRSIRSSKQRQCILDVIKHKKTHLSAEEIYQYVRELYPGISLGTVYRNLDILTEIGLISRATFADGKSRFEVAGEGHHHHLICIKCGEIEDMPECPMARDIQKYIEDKNFAPVQHYFEVYGYCTNCRQDIEGKDTPGSKHK